MGKRVLSTEAYPQPVWRRRDPPGRAFALALIVGLALLLHAALLSGLRWTWPGAAPAAPRGAVLQVRALDGTAPAAQGAGGPIAVIEPTPVASERAAGDKAAGSPERLPAAQRSVEPVPGRIVGVPPRAPTAPTARGLAVASLERVADPSASAKPVLSVAIAAPPAASIQAAAGVATSPAASLIQQVPGVASLDPAAASPAVVGPASDADAVPLYRTRPPPPATLRYALQLGAASGAAELRWRPTLEHYALELEGRVDGGTTLRQASEGGFDVAGLAPDRHTEQRSRRGMLATNCQRDAGRISFSGSGLQLPLVRGSQDRLSWIVQLAAVLAAEPERGRPGAVVAIPVAGLRGESGVWRFRAVDAEAEAGATTASATKVVGHDAAAVVEKDGATAVSAVVKTDGAPAASSVRWLRDRQGPYDVDVEVWLDPARHFLPSRVVMRTAAGAPVFQLVLRDAVFGP